MRWKERFLVPDHKVKDINGASFAGFYYVCVEAPGPAQPTPTHATQTTTSTNTPATESIAHAIRARRRATPRTSDPSAPASSDTSDAQKPSHDESDDKPTTTTTASDDDNTTTTTTTTMETTVPDFRRSLAPPPEHVPTYVSSPNSIALGSPVRTTRSMSMSSNSGFDVDGLVSDDDDRTVLDTPTMTMDQPTFDVDTSFDFDLDLDMVEGGLGGEEEDAPPPGTGALMCGYYFHPHSDP